MTDCTLPELLDLIKHTDEPIRVDVTFFRIGPSRIEISDLISSDFLTVTLTTDIFGDHEDPDHPDEDAKRFGSMEIRTKGPAWMRDLISILMALDDEADVFAMCSRVPGSRRPVEDTGHNLMEFLGLLYSRAHDTIETRRADKKEH